MVADRCYKTCLCSIIDWLETASNKDEYDETNLNLNCENCCMYGLSKPILQISAKENC